MALVRVEQLAPFPFDLVGRELRRYPNAEIMWCASPLLFFCRSLALVQQPWWVFNQSSNQSINYTFPALWLGVSKEIVYFCPPSLSILSQPCPRWQDPKRIQILSGGFGAHVLVLVAP